ncbi:MAG: TraR/DksA C4-type zinc finger protein [Alphaproteobacteria bacterium]|nr:TraR/DksA C4-type zinc finger protein [Alphaproteobacteria bacterium]
MEERREETTLVPENRYSDIELQEFAQLIIKKIDIAQNELAQYQSFITRKEELGDDGESGRMLNTEDGSISYEREQIAELAFRQMKFIDALKKAMIRIENKTYGICRVTGKLISKERLKRVPHATLSIEAKNTMNV